MLLTSISKQFYRNSFSRARSEARTSPKIRSHSVIVVCFFAWLLVAPFQAKASGECPREWRGTTSGFACHSKDSDGNLRYAALMLPAQTGFLVWAYDGGENPAPVKIYKLRVTKGYDGDGYETLFMFDTGSSEFTSPGVLSGDDIDPLVYNSKLSCGARNRRYCQGELKNSEGYYYGDLFRAGDGGPLTPQGVGIHVDTEGTIQIGRFVSGQLQGVGSRVIFVDGSEYVGELRKGKKNGYGEYYYASGTIYRGTWSDDLPDGLGAAFYADGKVWSGQWSKGKKSAGKEFASKALYDRQLRVAALAKDERLKRTKAATTELQNNLIALGLLESDSADGIAGEKTKIATQTVLSWFPSYLINLPDWAEPEQIETTADFILERRRRSVGTCSNAKKYANTLCFE